MPALNKTKMIYWQWRRCLASPAKCLSCRLRPWRCRIARRNKFRIFALNLNNEKLGFFANLNFCLHFLYYCDRAKLVPYITFTSPNYLDRRLGPCWFAYFFDNLALDAEGLQRVQRGDVRTCEARDNREMGFTKAFNREYYSKISIQLANELVVKYIGIKREISDEVEHFVKENFRGRKILAIHFRGTDKLIEAPRVSWDYCKLTINNYLNAHPDVNCIFVASDESLFVDYICREFSDITVCHHNDRQRSSGTRALHLDYESGDNYHKGEDALVNCLLMAQCDALIKSSSLLSAWASVFNPSLPVVLLNRPHREEDLWFPESELVRKSMDQYLPMLASP